MSWYDYIPVVGPISRDGFTWKGIGGAAADIATGGAYTGVRDAYDLGKGAVDKIHGANEEQKQGYYGMADMAAKLGDSQKAFQMQGLDRAEGYFGGARARLNAMYGSPNMGPPPGAPPGLPPGMTTGPAVADRSGRGAF